MARYCADPERWPVGAISLDWPTGIHWSPGEVRDVPEDWPGSDGEVPAWLVPVTPSSPPAAPPPEE